MSKRRNALLSLVLMAALLCGFAACDKGGDGETTTTTEAAAPVNGGGETTASPAQSGTVPSGTQTDPASSTGTQPSGVSDTAPSSTDGSTAQSAASSTATQTSATAAPTQAIPSTPAQVLAAYKTVMDQAKNEVKHFRKLDYQELPKDEVAFKSPVINAIFPVASALFTDKEKGMESSEYTDGIGDPIKLPVKDCPVGCMVTEPNAFQTAAGEQLADGNIKLTLIMKAEDNPEPPVDGTRTSPSKVGGMFEPMSKKNIDETIVNSAGVKAISSNLAYTLRYYDCKAVLVYNPKNQQIVSLDMFMKIHIQITDGKILGMTAEGEGKLYSIQNFDQFRYS